MVTRKPYRAGCLRLTSETRWHVAALLSTLLLVMAAGGPEQRPIASPIVTGGNAPGVPFTLNRPADDHPLPDLLSNNDANLYRAIFTAQKKNDWAAADASIRQLDNKLLMGYVLAQRYLNRHYDSSAAQLASWLAHYGDHPQATAIYALIMAKNPSFKIGFTLPKQPPMVGYGDDNGLAAQGDNAPYVRTFNAGLNAWRQGNKKAAARWFSGLVKHQETLPRPLAAAASYWAYRSYHALGNFSQAGFYLHLAALEPRCFYGILARKQLHQPLDLDTTTPHLSDSDVLEMIGEPAVRRTLALAQAGETDLADRELRAQFPQASMQEKRRLLALAYEIDLASVQIGMAKELSRDGQELDFARYPIPHWQPQGGFSIDPALMFALMRQESGFHASAISRGGALGLMQLMPQTALLMQKNMPNIAGNASEPVLNMTLGQNYIRHLLDNDIVGDNLFYMLAAYNAGPGRVQEWKQTIRDHDDPLLFVESIPYPQTRYYVMQVMANYWIYSELIGQHNDSAWALANGRWPGYGDAAARVAQSNISGHAG